MGTGDLCEDGSHPGPFPFWDKIIFRYTAATRSNLGHNSGQAVWWVSFPSVQVIMRRLYLYLRLLAVALAFPAIVVYIAAATLIHPIAAVRNRFRTALRLWMSVLDWVKGDSGGL